MPNGVLIIGAYGSGKSSLCEELAGVLETAGMAYGAIDLDWLGWYDAPGRRLDHDRRDPVAMANLHAITERHQPVGRFACVPLDALDGEDLVRQMGEQRGAVTRPGADFEDPLGTMKRERLECQRDDVRLRYRLSIPDRERMVAIGAID